MRDPVYLARNGLSAFVRATAARMGEEAKPAELFGSASGATIAQVGITVPDRGVFVGVAIIDAADDPTARPAGDRIEVTADGRAVCDGPVQWQVLSPLYGEELPRPIFARGNSRITVTYRSATSVVPLVRIQGFFVSRVVADAIRRTVGELAVYTLECTPTAPKAAVQVQAPFCVDKWTKGAHSTVTTMTGYQLTLAGSPYFPEVLTDDAALPAPLPAAGTSAPQVWGLGGIFVDRGQEVAARADGLTTSDALYTHVIGGVYA